MCCINLNVEINITIFYIIYVNLKTMVKQATFPTTNAPVNYIVRRLRKKPHKWISVWWCMFKNSNYYAGNEAI